MLANIGHKILICIPNYTFGNHNDAAEKQAVVTDESSAMEFQGLKPKIVEGRPDNIKITRPEDLALATFY